MATTRKITALSMLVTVLELCTKGGVITMEREGSFENMDTGGFSP